MFVKTAPATGMLSLRPAPRFDIMCMKRACKSYLLGRELGIQKIAKIHLTVRRLTLTNPWLPRLYIYIATPEVVKMMFPISYLVYSENYHVYLLITTRDKSEWRI